jgi:hypothetical protein
VAVRIRSISSQPGHKKLPLGRRAAMVALISILFLSVAWLLFTRAVFLRAETASIEIPKYQYVGG